MTGLQDPTKGGLENYEKLNGLADRIDEQFAAVLSKHENDFLNAYKGHMVKV